MVQSVASRLAEHARIRGGAEAVRVIGPLADAAPPMAFARLHQLVQLVARRVDRTCAPDATLMLQCGNRPELLPVFLGVIAAGRRLFPLGESTTAYERRGLAERAGARLLLTDAPDRVGGERDAGGAGEELEVVALQAWLNEDAPPGSSSVAGKATDAEGGSEAVLDRDTGWLLLQSSGTTGGPKIVRRDAASLAAVARNVAEAVGLLATDRVVSAVPLSHSYGIENGLLAPLWAGAAALHHVLPAGSLPGRGFDPGLAVTSGATVLPGVPAMFEMIDRMGAGRGRLRRAYSAGGPLPTELARRLEQRDGLRLGQLYGATEIGSVTYGPDPEDVGLPMRGVVVRVLDPGDPDPGRPLAPGVEGHVAVRGPSMFAGYVDPVAEAENPQPDGFFLTGDLGRLDGAGRLQITGRLKLLIDVGGAKVNPLEVEQQLASFPGVGECVVLPDPVSPTINRVRAMYTVDPNGVAPDEAELREFLRRRLAGYKVPRCFERRESLPKSATGKVLRRALLQPPVPA